MFQIPRGRSPFNNRSIRGYPKVELHCWHKWGLEQIKSNNGPKFNGREFKEYARERGFHHQLVTPEQPGSNGLAKNFMHMLQKVAQTA